MLFQGAERNFFVCVMGTFKIYCFSNKKPATLRYDLNQISYDYIVQVTNRFKRLYLTDRVPEELWTEVDDMVREVVIRTIPKRKKHKKAK